jgi:hypothetical protein
MPETRTVVLDGVSRLQLFELQDEFGSDAIQPTRNVPGLTFEALSNDTVVVLVIALPIAKAIARVIARDKVSFIYRSRRADGTEEEGTLTITRAASPTDSEEQIVKQLMGDGIGDEKRLAE